MAVWQRIVEKIRENVVVGTLVGASVALLTIVLCGVLIWQFAVRKSPLWDGQSILPSGDRRPTAEDTQEALADIHKKISEIRDRVPESSGSERTDEWDLSSSVRAGRAVVLEDQSGRPTRCGNRVAPGAIYAAYRNLNQLPCGTKIVVVNTTLEDVRPILVAIQERSGSEVAWVEESMSQHSMETVIALSPTAAREIGIVGAGSVKYFVHSVPR